MNIEPKKIRDQITKLTTDLIKLGLSDFQNYPVYRTPSSDTVEIGLNNIHPLSLLKSNLEYKEIYKQILEGSSYNVRMLDGALISILYTFKNKCITKHRLSFFPSPFLEEYQNNPEIYSGDDIYAEIINKNIVPFPFRYDYDSSVSDEILDEHPRSHLTLGQYRNCRIPVNAPLTPYQFIIFILKNLYNTVYMQYYKKITRYRNTFDENMGLCHNDMIHVKIPIVV